MTRARPPAVRRRDRGFTLIELVVVLAIMGLILGLVVWRGPLRSQRLETDAAARLVSGALRLARAEAIAQNRPVEVRVDIPGHFYRVDGGPPRPLPSTVAISVTQAMTGPGDGRSGAIRFAPDGSSSGGRIELIERARRVQIGVDWLTGRVSVVDAH